MKRLGILFGALGLLIIAAAGAQAGERHGKHYGGHHHSQYGSYGHQSVHYWAKSFFFGHHNDHGHRAYDRRYDRRYGHHRAERHYGHRHDYKHYKKHKHKYAHHKRRILPIKKIVKKLHRRHYHDISKIVLKRDRYKVRAYDRKGRPVKLIVNAHNGRILRKRYR